MAGREIVDAKGTRASAAHVGMTVHPDMEPFIGLDSAWAGNAKAPGAITPASADVRAYLMKVARLKCVPMDGLVPA